MTHSDERPDGLGMCGTSTIVTQQFLRRSVMFSTSLRSPALRGCALPSRLGATRTILTLQIDTSAKRAARKVPGHHISSRESNPGARDASAATSAAAAIRLVSPVKPTLKRTSPATRFAREVSRTKPQLIRRPTTTR